MGPAESRVAEIDVHGFRADSPVERDAVNMSGIMSPPDMSIVSVVELPASVAASLTSI